MPRLQERKVYNLARTGPIMAGGFSEKSVSLAEVVGSGQDDRPTWKEWDTLAAIRDGFKASSWVYACVDKIARAASMAKWKAQREIGPDDWQDVPGHPLELLVRSPNPFMSGSELVRRLSYHIYLGGNFILSKVRAGQVVAELWPLNPAGVTPIQSRKKFISSYRYDLGGIRLDLATDDIVHGQFPDPANPFWGMSPLQALAKIVDTDVEAVKFNKVALQNRAVSDGAWVFKQPLTRAQWEEARRIIREQHQGPSSARSPWVLGSEAKWEGTASTMIDLDFMQGRKLTREEIAAGFGVPPPLIGIYDKANLNNIKEARRVFWFDTMIAYLDSIRDVFNRGLAPEFGPGIRLVYDVSQVDVIIEYVVERIEAADKLWRMGVPFNVLNQRLDLGFDRIAGGDVGFVPANMMAASVASGFEELPGGGDAGGQSSLEEFEAKSSALEY